MKIALIGYGKMGKAIEQIAVNRGHAITLKSTSKAPASDSDLNNADVAIEFSTPSSAGKNIQMCIDADTPVVVGTTGWYDQFEYFKSQIEEKDLGMVHATNFSLGVNLFFKLNEMLAEIMSGFDYEPSMTEIHHTEKLDSPSGTAITLAEGILTKINSKTKWVNHLSDNKEDLEIVSVREPNVPGTHTISYQSEIDSIDITHTAHNRKGFALGAVLAAEWITSKKGVFTMKDVLNL